MDLEACIGAANDRLLFTPGPLTTSRTVKQAMLRDLGSRDSDTVALLRSIRERVLELGEVSKEAGYEAVLMQGSGTFGVESVITSAVPPSGKLLVVANGAYGDRIARIAEVMRIDRTVLRYAEDTVPDVVEVARTLKAEPAITHVAVVHCETTTGIMNPIEAIGAVVRAAGRSYIVDAMSSFAAVPISMAEVGIDFLITSANKCVEGVPGFSIILARREALLAAEGFARSLSLDLAAQWRGLEITGEMRFTAPIHAMLAFSQALDELDQEGGIAGRASRYQANYHLLVNGMREMGFKCYVPRPHQGYIITAFLYPGDPSFRFDAFYDRLRARGMVIYAGKLSQADTFRIANIGRLFERDILALLHAIRETLDELGVTAL